MCMWYSHFFSRFFVENFDIVRSLIITEVVIQWVHCCAAPLIGFKPWPGTDDGLACVFWYYKFLDFQNVFQVVSLIPFFASNTSIFNRMRHNVYAAPPSVLYYTYLL